MQPTQFYPIGTAGVPWGDLEKSQWLKQTQIKRSYQDEVLTKILSLADRFNVHNYGALEHDPERYPLLALTSRNWKTEKPKVLITGGVHGYETSGVQGALAFIDRCAEQYSEHFDLVVLPCISPWGYETINRWNPSCVDPNRSFIASSPSQEAAAAMAFVQRLDVTFLCHVDLHETTDTDVTEFRPALSAREGKTLGIETVPDGFYTVGDSENPQPEFQKAIIDQVRTVTHIAPVDEHGEIIGSKAVQEGVINYAKRSLGLCGGFSGADFVTTTEVYPDSPRATPEQCIEGQIAAICGGLNYLLALQ